MFFYTFPWPFPNTLLIGLTTRHFGESQKELRMNPEAFLSGHELTSCFAERKRLTERMVKGETSWRKKMLKCPSGEKSHFVKTKSWGCIYVLILWPWCHACSVYKSEWVSRSSQQCRVFLSSPCSVQLHQLTGTLGRLAQHSWRQETRHGSVMSAYDLASSTTPFSPNNVGKLNESHSKDDAPCVLTRRGEAGYMD